ncbi:ABC transporter ATP-binding protein [Kribbella sp. NPDC056861]|uniref:ABC transporter ATP-binding protein n=1 Tax=Kribbella sp. NPDC056861 TaxID=3154857 RepID=UPI00343BBFAC
MTVLTMTALGLRLRGGRQVLTDLTLRIHPADVTVIAGCSGAGKTLLLQTLAGVRQPTSGSVRHDGRRPGRLGPDFGFVPQDDIIHHALPLARTLTYAARLRLPAVTPRVVIDQLVADVLDVLGLSERAAVRVGALSGGERKRASIAVELLTAPTVLLLDEPTSGLDPSTAAGLMRTLRALTTRGTTVVLTTHSPADLVRSDRVLFLSPDGRLAYDGSAAGLTDAFGAATVDEVYAAIADGVRTPASPSVPDEIPVGPPWPEGGQRLGVLRQWLLLTHRSAEILRHDRLAVAVMAGSPLMIVAMFAVLFRAGAFDPAAPSPGTSAMILFWIAFGSFFFGLTYGLLQIVTELAIVRRERLSVLRLGSYLLSKLTLLLPVLALADAALLGVLRALDRLPSASFSVYGELFATSLLSSAAALAVGLLASALVSEPGQATLLLPLICFPQVLFSGAFVPVPEMALPGQLVSFAMTNRWAFEALGSGIGLEKLWATGASSLGPPLLASYGGSFSHPVWIGCGVLAAFAVACLALAWAVLDRRTGN